MSEKIGTPKESFLAEVTTLHQLRFPHNDPMKFRRGKKEKERNTKERKRTNSWEIASLTNPKIKTEILIFLRGDESNHELRINFFPLSCDSDDPATTTIRVRPSRR